MKCVFVTMETHKGHNALPCHSSLKLKGFLTFELKCIASSHYMNRDLRLFSLIKKMCCRHKDTHRQYKQSRGPVIVVVGTRLPYCVSV